MSNILNLIEEAKNVSLDIFKDLVRYEKNFYRKDINKHFTYKKGILKLDPEKYENIYVFGDIHGDFRTLSKGLLKIGFDKIIDNSLLIFLGDYIDRGDMQVEVLTLLFYIHKFHPDNVILLRGNHERPPWLPVYPHDFPGVLSYYFQSEAGKIYNELLEVFSLLPHIAYYENGLIFLHGGLPVNEDDLSKYTNEDREILTQILWNDPFDGRGYRTSFRGVGYLFGVDITENFLRKNSLRGLVRGHEPVDGYRISQKGYTLTLFTRLGPPYYNRYAAIYRFSVDSFRDFKSGEFIIIE